MGKMTDVWKRLKSRVSGETRLDAELNVPSFASGDALTAGESRRHPWGVVVKMIGVAVIGCLLIVRPARAQLGIDLAAILAALQNMQSLMQKYIAVPLQDINQAQQNIAKYEQEVMYPAQKIQQARGSVTQFEGQFHQVSGLFHINLSSATLPQTQAFESVLLSRNAGNIGSVTPQFQTVYGVVMPQNAASPEVRNMTDSTDAQAQDAMKRAIQIDALSDAELAEADKMGQQIAAAAPGSAPILEAEADAWVVRANAYTQAALAELMRTRGIDIANQSKAVKIGATQNTTTNGLLTTSLSH
jgi:hypothetical protein